jgi:D-beta-D-heptose 7-phosphate kinase/D-beta-D-heptose 1-phosphate adenosyltransferase
VRVPAVAPTRAHDLVRRITQSRSLVIGDVMLDHFIIGSVTRISPEAPVPVVAYQRAEYRAGGAANVALNVRALDGAVDLVGVIGPDGEGSRLVDLLHAGGVSARALITDEKRRTTAKVRIVTTRNQQVARIDYETDEGIAAAVEDALIDRIETLAPLADAVVVSDYLKGVVTRRVMAAVVAAAQSRGVPVLVDPKIPHLDYYTGASLVTPNHHEAEAATHMRIRNDDDARRAAALFRERARCEGVLVTRGEHGMWLAADGLEGSLPAAAREVSDVTGAGDTVVAVLAAATAAGATLVEAAHLANEAAGIVVGRFGPATVAANELLSRFPA